jgi:hypothetical protein
LTLRKSCAAARQRFSPKTRRADCSPAREIVYNIDDQFAFWRPGIPGEGIMKTRTVGLILLILGVLLIVLDLLIEPLQLGGGGGFGWKQIALLVVGIAAVGVGFVLGFRKNTQK